ncbi:hypothetical protein SAMN05428969_3439 [Devosia sp. YR412]|uniref:hypothetical protein n=1 Tax=Devosia sp. YR412 TaxID=1881030 RepID=UPI0008D759BC|nr:hypothetical protein [Devosia sp. YR412]SEQ53958.1 hypothetical protein SAMN05428969_3439 [Devosia sp. YR412]
MHRKSLFLSTAFALFSLSVMAGELDSFVAASDGATNCWSRAYDAKHMAAHPDQQVVAMDLAVTFMAQSDIGPEQYVFRLEATMRDGTQGQAVGPCMADGNEMWCGVECDGGGVYVSTRSGGNVLVDLERRGSIWMSTSCGDENFDEGFSLDSGRDDKQFLLSQLLPQFCLPAEY